MFTLKMFLAFVVAGCKSVIQNFKALSEPAYLVSVSNKDEFRILERSGKNADGTNKYVPYDGKNKSAELLGFTDVVDTLTKKVISIPVHPEQFAELKANETYLYKRNAKGFYNLNTVPLTKQQITAYVKALQEQTVEA